MQCCSYSPSGSLICFLIPSQGHHYEDPNEVYQIPMLTIIWCNISMHNILKTFGLVDRPIHSFPETLPPTYLTTLFDSNCFWCRHHDQYGSGNKIFAPFQSSFNTPKHDAKIVKTQTTLIMIVAQRH